MRFARSFLLVLASFMLALCTTGVLSDTRLVITSRDVLRSHTNVGEVAGPTRIAGYFELNRTKEAKMFFFFFEARRDPASAPVVLWMTGGPGCASELAIFYENGPYEILPNMTLKETEYGWDVSQNMIFVDQPINTGFSYSNDPRDRVHDEQGVADDMLDFLVEFCDAFPHLKENPFFVTGESYAGHYVPAVASRVFHAMEDGEAEINLQGFAIGNGLTDPAIQYSAYADYALDNGLIDKKTRDRIQMMYPVCRMGATVCAGHNWKTECLIALQFCQVAIWDRIMAHNPDINVYDITKKCDNPLCYDFSLAEKFLNLPQVQKALGVDREWEMCDPGVYRDMMGDWLKNLDTVIPPMLEAGVRVMVYAGDLDLICNWLGNYRWVSALPWSGRLDFTSADSEEWEVDGRPAGSVQEYGPLSFVKVYEAGHMVPMDQPAAALHMISQFTRDESLTKGTPKGKKLVKNGASVSKTIAA